MRKIAVFGSGNGSNFEAIVKYFNNTENEIEIICVSDKEDAFILERAKKLGINSKYVHFEDTEKFLTENRFDLIALAGYMRILPPQIIKMAVFLNIHPSLLPAYKGKDAIKRIFEAKEKITGVTVHVVTENIDDGLIIAQQAVTVPEDIEFEEFEKTIHKVEHYLYPRIIEDILFNQKSSCGSGCGSKSESGCGGGCSSGGCGCGTSGCGCK